MSKYSDDSLSLLLDGYWELFEGIVPGGMGRVNMNSSPHESVAILKADIDAAMNVLTNDCRWNEVLEALNAYYADGLNPFYLFYDNTKYFHMLNKYQKGVVRYHFKVTVGKKKYAEYFDEDEYFVAGRARKQMLIYLNNRATPREWHLISQLVEALNI